MINICLTEDLKETLAKNDITPDDYMPAYGGESVGLDLFNCGKTVNIFSGSYKPASSNFKTNNDFLIPTGLKLKVPQGCVRASINDRALTSKRHAPRAAVTPSNIELALINKLRHNKHASDTPALS